MNMELERPDHPSRCTWSPGAKDSPHIQRNIDGDWKKVLPNVLHVIGKTPMVRLENITKIHGIKCELLAKCEFLNPGGSVKDRIGYRMLQDAEEKGMLKPGSTIIEPTSGNTGIGLAMAAAVRGYRCIIVMPEKMSNEKIYTLKALGAEVVRTPTEAAWNSPEGHIKTAQKLRDEIAGSVILDQYTNPGNPLAHYDGTASEILEQCEGKLDYVIVGAGTGGTISGIGRKMHELSPRTKVVGIDPEGSILADTEETVNDDENSTTFYEVEGIGYDFIPTVLDRKIVDRWVKSNDKDSLTAARQLIKHEGILCGGSSGAALAAAIQIAKTLDAGKRVVVLLPDGIRNYLTKFASDRWMEERGFMDPPKPIKSNEWWWHLDISSLIDISKPENLPRETTCEKALKILQNSHLDRVAVLDEKNCINGLVTCRNLMSRLIDGTANESDPVVRVMERKFPKVCRQTSLGRLSRILENEPFAVLLDEHRPGVFLGFVSQKDLLNFVRKARGEARRTSNGDA